MAVCSQCYNNTIAINLCSAPPLKQVIPGENYLEKVGKAEETAVKQTQKLVAGAGAQPMQPSAAQQQAYLMVFGSLKKKYQLDCFQVYQEATGGGGTFGGGGGGGAFGGGLAAAAAAPAPAFGQSSGFGSPAGGVFGGGGLAAVAAAPAPAFGQSAGFGSPAGGFGSPAGARGFGGIGGIGERTILKKFSPQELHVVDPFSLPV